MWFVVVDSLLGCGAFGKRTLHKCLVHLDTVEDSFTHARQYHPRAPRLVSRVQELSLQGRRQKGGWSDVRV